MNIVVFGCDNSGKTTLAKVLDSILGIGYIHSPGPLKDVEDMKRFIESNLDNNTVNIFDRLPIIEENTCGVVLRGKNLFGSLDNDYTAEVFNRINLFIYCRPGYESVSNWGDREQMAGIKENIDKLIESYDDVYDYLYENGYPVLKYDYNTNGRFIKYEEVEN